LTETAANLVDAAETEYKDKAPISDYVSPEVTTKTSLDEAVTVPTDEKVIQGPSRNSLDFKK
jgi:hypothetical protein